MRAKLGLDIEKLIRGCMGAERRTSAEFRSLGPNEVVIDSRDLRQLIEELQDLRQEVGYLGDGVCPYG